MLSISASSVEVAPMGGVAADGVGAVTITVTVRDGLSQPMAGVPVMLQVSGAANTVEGEGATDTQGQRVFLVRSTRAESKQVQVSVEVDGTAVLLLNQPQIVFVAGVPHALRFVAPLPLSAVAGTALDPAPTLQIEDAHGNLVSNVAVPITVTCSASALIGTATRTSSQGHAVFTGLAFTTAVQGATLTASAPLLQSAQSTATNVIPGAAAQLRFTQQPSDVVAFASMAPAPEVVVEDVHGNTVSTPVRSVTLSLRRASGGDVALNAPRDTVDGVASFDGLSIPVAEETARLVATTPGLPLILSNVFRVAPLGTATRWAFHVQPSDVTAGVSMAPEVVVEARDDAGTLDPTATGTVTVRLADGVPGTLQGTTTLALSGGRASFRGLQLQLAGSNVRLRAEGAGLMPVDSEPFTVDPAAAVSLHLTSSPSDVTADQVLPPVVAEARDRFGNHATSFTQPVTVQLHATPVAGAELTGTTTVDAQAGTATLDAVNLRTVGAGYSVRVVSNGLQEAVSGTFSVSVGMAAALQFITQPTEGTAGVALSTIQVGATDAWGNSGAAWADGADLALQVPVVPGMVGAPSALPQDGVATFTDVVVEGAGVHRLVATSGVLTGESEPITVASGPATQLVFETPPGPSTVNANPVPAVVVAARDAFGNHASSFEETVRVELTEDSPPAFLTGVLNAAAVEGRASFDGFQVDTAADGYRLVAISGTMRVESEVFRVSPAGAATGLRIVSQPIAAVSGEIFTEPIVVEAVDDAGTVASSFSGPVVITLLGSDGELAGTLVRSMASGTVAFDDLVITGIAGNYTLLIEHNVADGPARLTSTASMEIGLSAP